MFVLGITSVADHRVEKVDVEIGIVDGARVQILSGLAVGDEVLLQ